MLPQGDWAPPATPALWGRLSDYDAGGHQQQQQAPQQQQPHHPPQYQQGEFLSIIVTHHVLI